jgi:hypothetical protein
VFVRSEALFKALEAMGSSIEIARDHDHQSGKLK